MNPWRILENLAYAVMVVGLLLISSYVLAAYAASGRN